MGSSREAARAALARGDILVAYDQAALAVADDSDDLEARFLAALALARAGAATRAETAAAELRRRLAAAPNAAIGLREDADALIARLAKDRALASAPAPRAGLLADAAVRYANVAAQYDSAYAAVNAATLWLLAGDAAQAKAMAGRATELAQRLEVRRAGDDYWRAATLAEAALVVGDVEAARAAVKAAELAGGRDFAAMAVTRAQLRLVCDANGIDRAVLEPLAPPRVIHFCGARRIAPQLLPEIAAGVREFLATRHVGFGFGSLASGADIVIAEALLERGSELHVVLPFAADAFEAVSVEPAGPTWSARFRACLESATSLSYASDSEYLDDDSLFAHAARIAMGGALNRATYLQADAEQLAIWDRTDTGAPAGTARDVEQWRALDQPVHVVSLPTEPTPRRPAPAVAPSARAVRGILFADFRGFSRLRDQHFSAFVDVVMGALAAVLDRGGDAVLWRNSWGDAIQGVFTDAVSTAECALGFQEAVAAIDFAAAGLPDDLQLRIGAHVGPIISIVDHVRHEPTFVGREPTRAARIEPLTPTGEVYVTDAFAAILALDAQGAFGVEYVGRITTAKAFETIPMYRLHRTETKGTP